MAAVVPGAAEGADWHLVKARRQVGIHCPGVGAPTAANVGDSHIPARPVWLTEIIAIINGLDRALNEVMVVVGGVGRGPAGVAQLHLQRGVDDRARRENRERQRQRAGED